MEAGTEVNVYGWPQLTREQVESLYCVADPGEQNTAGSVLGLCAEAQHEIVAWHEESSVFEHYERERAVVYGTSRRLWPKGSLSHVRPLGPQVVLERIKNDVSDGGIIIPEQALDRASTFWRVLAVGPGLTLENGMVRPMSLVPEDVVAMIPAAHRAGGEIDLTDSDGIRRRVLVIHEDSCVAVVT